MVPSLLGWGQGQQEVPASSSGDLGVTSLALSEPHSREWWCRIHGDVLAAPFAASLTCLQWNVPLNVNPQQQIQTLLPVWMITTHTGKQMWCLFGE